MKQARLLLHGAGNVGRRFLELLVMKEALLREKLGLVLRVVGVADSSGTAACAEGLDLRELIALKQSGKGLGSHADGGRPGMSGLDMVRTCPAELFVEASPGNLLDGQPGLACIEAALDRRLHVVTANKSPLVLAYPRLTALATGAGVRLGIDATVAGGLPAVNLGKRDLGVAQIERLEGILNLTTHYILSRMEEGLGYEAALLEAQAAGHAETDPRLDVEGWDAAAKLVILSHSVLGYPATLDQVAVEGVTGISTEMLREAAADGRRIRLVALAERRGATYRLSVRPSRLMSDHPLARLASEQMGILFHTDICGTIAASIVEETPLPTAAALLRDVVSILSG